MNELSSMGAQILRQYPVRDSWLRWVYKAPLVLWRMGLGFLLGRYIMVITTSGRKSGLPRHTMAEWHPLNGGKFVPVNYGERAQWYRNIEADPRVTIQTSDGTQSAIARRITDDDELIAAYHVIKTRNPMMAQWYLNAHDLADSEADLLARKDRIYLLAFDPTGEPTPPPLEADLTWVWALVFGIWWLLFGGRRRRW
ncbi:MAG: nitroreductase family deazaflavin-dependent oxidoreductase [Chloroflexi bacterium]|nr:nitroreductase family deazaflavin-dependent oxidoreductase [Chloroflexota bacterium]